MSLLPCGHDAAAQFWGRCPKCRPTPLPSTPSPTFSPASGEPIEAMVCQECGSARYLHRDAGPLVGYLCPADPPHSIGDDCTEDDLSHFDALERADSPSPEGAEPRTTAAVSRSTGIHDDECGHEYAEEPGCACWCHYEREAALPELSLDVIAAIEAEPFFPNGDSPSIGNAAAFRDYRRRILARLRGTEGSHR